MMTDDDSNNTGDDGALLPWYDYEPGAEVPNHVKYLRIGVQQALTAAVKTGTAPGIIELPDRLCGQATNLRRVQIHVHAVELIPWNAFAYCSKLEQVEFVASTGQSSAAAATSNLPVQSPRLTRIGDYAFGGCSMLRSVDGMSNVSCCLARIGDNAFRRCEKLTALDLHCLARLQFLELFSFYECKSLTVVDLSNSVLLETICEYTFSFCMDLKVVHLPPNLKQIQSNAFRDCNALASIVIPASVEFMGHHAFFDCPSLTRITFQSTRHWHRLLNDQQFSLCTSLHTLELQRPPAITAELWSIHKAFADIAESRPIPWLHLAAYLGVGGLPHQRKLWPLLLEQFLPQTHNGMFARAGIRQGPQRSTMAWNFLRANIANFYVREEKNPAVGGRKRDFRSSSGYNGGVAVVGLD